MAHAHSRYPTVRKDPEAAKRRNSQARKMTGKGGTRQGFVPENEIEDMTLFDKDPGKIPGKDSPPKPKSH